MEPSRKFAGAVHCIDSCSSRLILEFVIVCSLEGAMSWAVAAVVGTSMGSLEVSDNSGFGT
jgi:hypothetical protein